MIEYAFGYIFVWVMALLSLFLRADFKAYKSVFLAQLLFLCLMAMLRFETGYDWPVYRAHYEALRVGSDFHLDFSLLYSAFVRFLIYLGIGFSGVTALSSLFSLALIGWVVWKLCGRYAVVALSIIYSIPNLYLVPEFSLIRFSLASSIFCYSAVLVFHRNIIRGWLLLLLAPLLHTAIIPACFLIFFMMLFRLKFDVRLFLFAYGLGAVFFLFEIDVFRTIIEFVAAFSYFSQYELYLSRDVFNASLLYRVFFLGVSSFLVFLLIQGWKWVSQANINWMRPFFIFSMIAIVLPLYLFSFPTITSRIQYLFSPFLVACVLLSLRRMTLRTSRAVIFLTGIVLLVPFYRFLASPFSIAYIPYQSVIFYDERSSSGSQRTQELLDLLHELWD